MKSGALYSVVIVAASATFAIAEQANWPYVGTITRLNNNTIGAPSPVGLPVKLSINFDYDSVVDSPSIQFGGRYSMSGGITSFSVQVGDHVSDPITKFRMDAISDGSCCALGYDLYAFYGYDNPGDAIRINFPGFVENAVLLFSLRMRLIPGPIDSNALPLSQPNPVDFAQALLTINTRNAAGDIAFSFASTNLRIAVPEPAGLVFAGGVTACGAFTVRRREYFLATHS